MNWIYPFEEDIHLHVKNRISNQAAQRQERTAREILRRLRNQPGLILADEVGMGKTFVALSVALSIALAPGEQKPVVVMIPSTLKEKWPRDMEFFLKECLPPEKKVEIRYTTAQSPVEFYKLLDDPKGKRNHVIFLTHGALSRNIRDGWVKAALIYRAMYSRRNKKFRNAVIQCLGSLVELKWVKPVIWRKLLSTPLEGWFKELQSQGIPLEDDPIPGDVIKPLMGSEVDTIYKSLWKIPLRDSKNYEDRVMDARREINNELKVFWSKLIRSMHLKLPLLILDEAHHLKNARTKIAGLFQQEEAVEDMEEAINRGPLYGTFERMLFLTATPFQLGHHELCSVLERFEAVSWKGDKAPSEGLQVYKGKICELRKLLDSAQDASIRFDKQWSKLQPEDMIIGEKMCTDENTWWTQVYTETAVRSERTEEVIRRYNEVNLKMRRTEELLKPWVIRHLKEYDGIILAPDTPRRIRLTGKAILEDKLGENTEGLDIAHEAVLPFLLAARTAALLPRHRAVFAEGLASSYEAFIETKKNRKTATVTDLDDEALPDFILDPNVQWYVDKIEQVLATDLRTQQHYHPKMDATVRRVLELWKKGEKVVVFCHYIATGKALRRNISNAIRKEILSSAANRLDCDETKAEAVLDKIGKLFFAEDSLVRKQVDIEIHKILKPYALLEPFEHKIMEVIRRYLRTPSFLTRHFQFENRNLTPEAVVAAFKTQDESGLSLRETINQFLLFLLSRSESERIDFISAVHQVQTGGIRTLDNQGIFEDDELQGEDARLIQPNVRLVNGTVRPETRYRLILAFNTPFYPEILITSSVMAEGVDLHLNCRHVIHHDLCWNPSTLEQRTGRVDRIGSKSEIAKKPIRIYLPYISQTQDEKMYRVVLDRERWFKVIMGEKFQVDEFTTDRLALRIPLPKEAADALAFKLEVADTSV